MAYIIPAGDDEAAALLDEQREIIDQINGLQAELETGINSALAQKVERLAQRQAEIREALEKYRH